MSDCELCHGSGEVEIFHLGRKSGKDSGVYGCPMCIQRDRDVAEAERDQLRERLKFLDGMAVVPKRMTKEMRQITSQEEWTWEDLLAAAEAITEQEYEDLQRSAVPDGSLDAEIVLALLDSQQWMLKRELHNDSLTEEANRKYAWRVERQLAPYVDKLGMRVWSGPTAYDALANAHHALGLAMLAATKEK